MILVDYSQTVIAAFFANNVINDPEEYLMRHVVLNTLRSYVHKYSKDYGQLIVCADGKNTWRKEYFPHYKGARAKSRQESDVDWKFIFDTMTKILEEIKDVHLFPAIRLEGAEADDVIGVLAEHSYRNSEQTLIISSDKDFRQLQKYDGIHQFSPMKNEMIVEKNPHDYLIEHIIKGDSGDGVPNVFSDDDVFMTEGKRQAPATKKKIQQLIDYVYGHDHDGSPKITNEWKRNYDRNKTLVDLDCTPVELCDKIKNEFEQQNSQKPDKAKFLDYLINNRCKLLIESIDEFFVK